jgi:hypothetical protein
LLVFLQFLGCALVFGFVGQFALTLPFGLLASRIHLRRLRAPARRMGEPERAELLAAAERGEEDPRLLGLAEQMRAAAEASAKSLAPAIRVMNIAPWVIGAAASWLLFYA